MAKHKGELEIGMRAYEELRRRFPALSDETISKRIGMDRKSMYAWRDGLTPGGYALQRLYFAGCDIKYILTGRRDPNGR